MIVPNGSISGIRVIPAGRRRVRLEMLTADPETVEAMVHEIGGAVAGAGGPWDRPPRVVVRSAEGGLSRLIAIVEIDPSREGRPRPGWPTRWPRAPATCSSAPRSPSPRGATYRRTPGLLRARRDAPPAPGRGLRQPAAPPSAGLALKNSPAEAHSAPTSSAQPG